MASTIPYDEHTNALKDAWNTANFLAYGNAKALLNHNYRGLYRKVYFLDIQKGKLKKISSNIVNDNIFPDMDFVLRETICTMDWRYRIKMISTIDDSILCRLLNWLNDNTGYVGVGGVELLLLTFMLHPEVPARYPRLYAVSQLKQREFKNEIRRKKLPPSEIINEFREFLTLIKKRPDYVRASSERPAHRYQLRPRKPVVYSP